MQLSYWERSRFFNEVWTVVIGSGIVGLSTAIELKRKFPSKSVLVLERGFLPYGASTRNAGFACFGSITELEDDWANVGLDKTLSLVEKRWKGLLNLRQLLGDQSIGLERNGGYEVFTDTASYEKVRDRMAFFNQAMQGIFAEEVYRDAPEAASRFGFQGVKGSVLNRLEAQIDTGEMMGNLLKLAQKEGVVLLNGLEVEAIETDEIRTTAGFSFKAKHIVVTTNGFAKTLLPELNVEPARAQVLVTEPIPGLKLKGTFHYDKGYYYFRNIGNRVLFGGGRNMDFSGENTVEMSQTPLIQGKLEQLLSEMIVPYSEVKIDLRWSGIMGVGQERNPIVKKLSDHLYCGVRMGGMGVAIGSLVGKEIAEMISVEENA